MDDENETGGDGSSAEDTSLGGGTDTTSTEDTTTTAGGGTSGGTQQTSAGGANGQTPPERVFSQADVNRFIAEERRKWERTRRVAPPAQRPAGTETRPQFDPATIQALEEYLSPRLAPLRDVQVRSEINDAVTQFGHIQPEFAQLWANQETRNAFLQPILDLGEEFVQNTPMSILLDYGWLKHKYGNFDEKKFRADVEADYIKRQSAKSRQAGTPQGGGGKSTTTPKPRGKEWADADTAMKQLIDEAKAAG